VYKSVLGLDVVEPVVTLYLESCESDGVRFRASGTGGTKRFDLWHSMGEIFWFDYVTGEQSPSWGWGVLGEIVIRKLSQGTEIKFVECNERQSQERAEFLQDLIGGLFAAIRANEGQTDSTEATRRDSVTAPQLVDLYKLRRAKIWEKIKPMLNRGEKMSAILVWLNRMHPELTCDRKTLAKVIKEGEAGLLDGLGD